MDRRAWNRHQYSWSKEESEFVPAYVIAEKLEKEKVVEVVEMKELTEEEKLMQKEGEEDMHDFLKSELRKKQEAKLKDDVIQEE